MHRAESAVITNLRTVHFQMLESYKGYQTFSDILDFSEEI
jgi:hypothetical protein